MGEFSVPNQEQGEVVKAKPAYYVFLGRHAEKSEDDEISSLSLKGIYDAHDVGDSLINRIATEIPEGKIRLKLLNARAYRTKETLEVIADEIKAEAMKAGKILDITEPQLEERFLEQRGEAAEESVEEMSDLLKDIKKEALESMVPLVVIGVLHEDRLKNFLSAKLGKQIDQIETAEFAEINGDQASEHIVFRGVEQNTLLN